MSPSKVLFFLCLSFTAGIFLQSVIKIPQLFVCGVLFLGIMLTFISFLIRVNPLFNRINPSIIGFCLLLLVIGILRVQISDFNIANDNLSKFNDKGKITLTGVISGEPDIRDTFQKIEVKVENSTVLITTKRYPEYKYLDEVKITGKLETPSVTDTFNYKNYLLKDHIYSVMGFPQIEVKSRYNIFLAPRSLGEVGSFLYEKIIFSKEKIRESIQKNFLPPQSSILEGTILGDNGAMSTDLKNNLNITGLRHIIAVSGTHVIILSSIIMSLLLAMGLWRKQAFYVAIFIILIYIILTGLPPSGVRAGIMGGVYLLSQMLGRQSIGLRLITIACAVMLLINPLLLIYDVGFQLSFLAVLGLILIDPLIKLFIKKFTKDKAENFVSIVSATFAAQIFTLPIMVYNFGNVSFVSPITNLLVLPIVYWLMVFGFLSSILGIFWGFLGWIFSVPCYFLLSYFLWIIDFFSQPWAMKTFSKVHWIWLVLFYLLLASAIRYLNRQYIQKFT